MQINKFHQTRCCLLYYTHRVYGTRARKTKSLTCISLCRIWSLLTKEFCQFIYWTHGFYSRCLTSWSIFNCISIDRRTCQFRWWIDAMNQLFTTLFQSFQSFQQIGHQVVQSNTNKLLSTNFRFFVFVILLFDFVILIMKIIKNVQSSNFDLWFLKKSSSFFKIK